MPATQEISTANEDSIRFDWTLSQAMTLFDMPFFDLLDLAHQTHRSFFDPHEIQISTLKSIKTGSCPEDCKYCPQSAHYNTGLEKERLIAVEKVLADAKKAKEAGATRFCMGAAWRGPNDKDLDQVVDMVKAVKGLGLETCATLGLLKAGQAEKLKDAGLDYYNHNLDSSDEFYKEIISTRTFQDRLDTLSQVRDAGMKVCCGGIMGMGETVEDRAKMLVTLANMQPHPESVPINQLIPIPGTPLGNAQKIESFDFIRVIAITRIMMPTSYVRLSAGREDMSDEMQSLCFFAGANSMFYGETLLTAANPKPEKDLALLAKLGMKPEGQSAAIKH